MKTNNMVRVPVFIASLAVLAGTNLHAASTITFDNQSGKDALVKLVGPTRKSVTVENGRKETVEAAAGRYLIKARYGEPGRFTYSKGDEFDVTETSTSFSQITITLHKVIGGNYGTREITEKEFGLEDGMASSTSDNTLPGKAPPSQSRTEVVELIPANITDAESKRSTTRVVIAKDEHGIIRNDAPSVGWKQQMLFETGTGGQLQAFGHNWGIGAEHAFKISIRNYGTDAFRFDVEGDKDFPLTFKVTQDGYAYLCGRGTITVHGYQPRKFGCEKTEQDWLAGLRSDHQLVREGSAEAAGWLKLKAAVPHLVQSLSDSAWEVRRNACEALGIIGDAAATDAVQKLTADPNDEVKAVAKEALQRLRGEKTSTRDAPIMGDRPSVTAPPIREKQK
jgi:hypothetical protein